MQPVNRAAYLARVRQPARARSISLSPDVSVLVANVGRPASHLELRWAALRCAELR